MDNLEKADKSLLNENEYLKKRLQESTQRISGLERKSAIQCGIIQCLSREVDKLVGEKKSLLDSTVGWQKHAGKVEKDFGEVLQRLRIVLRGCETDTTELKKKIQELEKCNEQLRTNFEGERTSKEKNQSPINARFTRIELISKLNQVSDEKQKLIRDHDATERQLKDEKKELEKNISWLKNELVMQDSRIECLSRHICKKNCVPLALSHVLFKSGYDWCEHVLVKTAMVNATKLGAYISLDEDLFLCAKSMELFKNAKFVKLFGEEEIENISDLLQRFREKFPNIYGILALSRPFQIGHAVAVEPARDGPRIYCPQSGRYLDVKHIVGEGYSRVQLYLLDDALIRSIDVKLSSMDRYRELCCTCRGGTSDF